MMGALILIAWACTGGSTPDYARGSGPMSVATEVESETPIDTGSPEDSGDGETEDTGTSSDTGTE